MREGIVTGLVVGAFPVGRKRAAVQARVAALAEVRFIVQADRGEEHDGDDENEGEADAGTSGRRCRQGEQECDASADGWSRSRLVRAWALSEMDEVRRVGHRGCGKEAMVGRSGMKVFGEDLGGASRSERAPAFGVDATASKATAPARCGEQALKAAATEAGRRVGRHSEQGAWHGERIRRRRGTA